MHNEVENKVAYNAVQLDTQVKIFTWLTPWANPIQIFTHISQGVAKYVLAY
jgi:hypothetical protein